MKTLGLLSHRITQQGYVHSHVMRGNHMSFHALCTTLQNANSVADGTTTMTGLAELRVKESDRLLMVAEGLKACGVNLEMGEESLTIHGTGTPPKGGATIETALDHRIAMAFLVLGCVSDEPITVDDGTPIQTSFPNFVTLMNELGADIS